MRLPDKIEGLKKTVPTPESVGVVSSEHIPPEHAPTKETVTASAREFGYWDGEERDDDGRWTGGGGGSSSGEAVGAEGVDPGQTSVDRNNAAMAKIGEAHNVQAYGISDHSWGISDQDGAKTLGKVEAGRVDGAWAFRATDNLGADIGTYTTPKEAVSAVASTR